MTDTDIAYCAGFFDGEGWCRWNVSESGEGARVAVSQMVREPLDFLCAHFGGTIYRQHSGKAGIWVWALNGRKAILFLETVLPYLMVKYADAKEVLERSQERLVRM